MSYAALPTDLREMLQRRLGDLERQLLSKVAELEDEKSLLHNNISSAICCVFVLSSSIYK